VYKGFFFGRQSSKRDFAKIGSVTVSVNLMKICFRDSMGFVNSDFLTVSVIFTKIYSVTVSVNFVKIGPVTVTLHSTT
jgi:hypothetical protein